MPTMQPPPTWANPVLVNEQTRQGTFHPVWLKWFLELAQTLTASGAAGGGAVDHNSTGGKQGGSPGQFFHLTAALINELQRLDNVVSVSADTTLGDTNATVLVTATGKTITLPPMNSARLGKNWTVVLGVAGYVDIIPSGADTFNLPVVDGRIRLDVKGMSMDFRGITSTSWGIV